MLKSEILFVDPAVSDIATILGGLRPEVEAIVLDSSRPAARQISAALRDRRGLDAVHVIAHGAPGGVRFAAGEWSADNGGRGRRRFGCDRLGAGRGRQSRLWSCRTGAGDEGADFVALLARAAGAHVGAATHKVGAAALGGAWTLALGAYVAAARPPLTEAGVATHAGVFQTTVTSRSDGEKRRNYLGSGPAPKREPILSSGTTAANWKSWASSPYPRAWRALSLFPPSFRPEFTR